MEILVNLPEQTVTLIDPTLQEMCEFFEATGEDYADLKILLEWSENL